MLSIKNVPYIVLAVVATLYLSSINSYLDVWGDDANFILLSKGMLTEHRYCIPTCPNPPPYDQFPFIFPIMLIPIVAIFGYNFMVMKLLITCIAIGSVWLVYKLFCPIVGERIAILLMILTGFSAHIGQFSHKVMSELPYLLFTLGGLIYLHKYQREVTWRSKNGLIAGVLITVAYFTRSIGLSLAIAAVIYLLIEGIRRSNWKLNLKKAIVIGVLFIIPFLLWEVRSYLVTCGNPPEYARYFFMRDPYTPDLGTINLTDMLERIHENFTYYMGAFSEATFNVLYRKLVGNWIIYNFIFYIICMGLIYCLIRQRTAIEYVTLAYMLIIYTWPWSGSRFIVPVIPFAIYYFIVGVGVILFQIARIRYKSLRVLAILPLFLLGSYPLATHLWGRESLSLGKWLLTTFTCISITLALREWKRIDFVKVSEIVLVSVLAVTALIWHVHADVIHEHQKSSYYQIDNSWGEYYDMAKWLKENTSPNSIVLCRKKELMHLWSGCNTHIYPFTKDRSRILNLISELKVDYIAVDSFEWTDTTQRYLKPAIESDSDRLKVIQQIGESIIYKVLPPGLFLTTAGKSTRY